MQYARKIGALLAAAALLIALPSAATAQHQMRFDVDGWGGVALPAGALNEIADVGATVGGGIAFRFHPHFALRGDVELTFLTEVESAGTEIFADMDLIHFNGGFEFNFAQPEDQDQPLTFSINLGAGATRMESDATSFVPAFEQTYFTLNGGTRIGYQVHPKVNIFARGTLYLILADEDDTAIFAGTPLPAGFFSEGWSVPITVGVRVSAP
ncbi:MAG: hypothetical protein ACE5JR_10580 [Gemmatimonadota bacterium]